MERARAKKNSVELGGWILPTRAVPAAAVAAVASFAAAVHFVVNIPTPHDDWVLWS